MGVDYAPRHVVSTVCTTLDAFDRCYAHRNPYICSEMDYPSEEKLGKQVENVGNFARDRRVSASFAKRGRRTLGAGDHGVHVSRDNFYRVNSANDIPIGKMFGSSVMLR